MSCQRIARRVFDVVGALIGLVLLSPCWLAALLGVAAFLGRPVLFRQRRLGLDGRAFELIKFKSMTDARDAAGRLLPDAERLTRFGRMLRMSSLDELPELINVLRGDMSLIGPRPLLPEYWDLYTPEQRRRHRVKPGLTGWAQVNGRNAVGWEEKLALDVWYADHQSWWLDLRILLRTPFVVVSRRGVSARDHATAPRFAGKAEM